MQWYMLALRRSFDMTGRSTRAEYWLFVLIDTLIKAVLIGLAFFNQSFGTIAIVYVVLTVAANYTVTIRRLHDTDRSGMTMLWLLFPVIGTFALVVFCCEAGTKGNNRYGPDPKAKRDDYDVSYGAPITPS